MARVAVVEHCASPRVSGVLTNEGFDVETVVDHGLDPDGVGSLLEALQPDLIVVEGEALDDWIVAVCSSLTGAVSVPVALVCAGSGGTDVLAGYDAGAAVVLTEPMGSHELVARIRALLRRAVAAPIDDDVLRVGPITLDPGRRTLTVSGVPIPLPRKEFDIAEILMQGSGTLVTRRELLDRLWGGRAADSKTLDVQVGRLRSRLSAVEGRRRIVTVRGVGYRFLTDVDLTRIEDAVVLTDTR